MVGARKRPSDYGKLKKKRIGLYSQKGYSLENDLIYSKESAAVNNLHFMGVIIADKAKKGEKLLITKRDILDMDLIYKRIAPDFRAAVKNGLLLEEQGKQGVVYRPTRKFLREILDASRRKNELRVFKKQ